MQERNLMGIYEYDFDVKSGFSSWRVEHVHGVVSGREKHSILTSSVHTDRTYGSSSIRHSSHIELEFTITTKDGREEYVETVRDMPVRDGDRVTLVRALSDGGTQFGVSLINHTLEKQYTINEAKQLFVLNAFYAVVAVLLPILYVRFFSVFSTSDLFDLGAWFIAVLIGLIPGIILLSLSVKLLRYLPTRRFQKKLDILTKELLSRYQVKT